MNEMKEKLRYAARLILGLLFIFSGFVKGIDPVGLQYKLQEYLEVIHGQSFDFVITPGAYLLPFVEFLLGTSLITGRLISISTKLVLLLLLFFTPFTFYLALKNPVTDCGCFGDALVLTNWQTFYKNLFLLLLAIVQIWPKPLAFAHYNEKLGATLFKGLVGGYVIAVLWSSFYEPIFDFRPYKIGVNIQQAMTIPPGAPVDVYTIHYNYINTKTKEIKKFEESNYPWRDTVNWRFESIDTPILIRKGYSPPIHDFTIFNETRLNVTDEVLGDKGYTLLIIAYNLDQSAPSPQKHLNQLALWAMQKGYHTLGLTSSSGKSLEKFKASFNPNYPFLFADQTPLKTMIRSNPGLILLHQGTILGKWSYHNLPSPGVIEHLTSTSR